MQHGQLMLSLNLLLALHSVSDSRGDSVSAAPESPTMLQAQLQAAADAGRPAFRIKAGEYNFSAVPLTLHNAAGMAIRGDPGWPLRPPQNVTGSRGPACPRTLRAVLNHCLTTLVILAGY